MNQIKELKKIIKELKRDIEIHNKKREENNKELLYLQVKKMLNNSDVDKIVNKLDKTINKIKKKEKIISNNQVSINPVSNIEDKNIYIYI